MTGYPPDSDARVGELVRILREAEQELHLLTGRRVEAVVGGGGGADLLQEAQQRLQASEAAQRRLADTQSAILNALSPHIALIDAHGTIQSVNASWRTFAAANQLHSPDFGIGKNYLAVCDHATGDCAEESAAAAEGIRRVLRGEANEFTLEYPCHSPLEQRWFRLMVAPLGWDGAAGAAVMHVDITALKLGEMALRASEQQFSNAFQFAPIGVALVSLDGRYFAVNQAFGRILGYDAAELLGKSFEDITHPADLAADVANVQRLMDGVATAYEMEKRYIRKDGQPVWVLLSVSLVRGDSGDPVHFISQVQDRTEHRQASKALHIQAHMLDQIAQAVITTDLDGTIIFANRYASELYGWPRSELVGRSILDVTVTRATQAQADAVMSQLRRGEPWHGEFIVRSRGGREFPVEITNSHILDEHGELAGIVGVSNDISERKQAEAASARLAAIVESSDDAIVGKDLNGVITSWNRGAETIYGYTSAEMVGRTIQPLIPGGAVDEEEVLFNRIRKGESVDRLEAKRLTKDRRLIDVSITLSPIKDAAGTIIGVAKIARDVTSQKRAAEDLKASEVRLAAAQALARLGSWELDLDTLTGSFSEEMFRLVYRDPALGTPTFAEFREAVHPDDRTIVDAALAGQHQAPGPISIDYRTNPALGPVRHLTATLHVVCDAGGRAVRTTGTAMDITERREEEARRLATERRFRRLVESNAQGVLFWEGSGAIVDANDALLTMIGYSREDLAQGRLNTSALTPPEYAALDFRAMSELAATGVCAPFEKEYLRQDGTRVPILIGAAAFEDRPDEGVAFVVDLTERKKLEKQFLRAQRMESIGTLAGGIAHDLNNVLAPILMGIELLRENNPSSESQEMLSTLETSAKRGADLVKQVLSFARGVEGERVHVTMARLMRDLLKVMRDTFPKSIDIHLESVPDLWVVSGDPTQLHQVFMNLCVNARDAMPHGGRLQLTMENVVLDETYTALNPDARPGPYVMVKVADTGTGIPPEIRDKVFEPFYTTKDIGKGTGLGLSTTMAIVKSHGGFINLYSEVGRGTKFKVYVPANTTAALADDVAVAQSGLPRGHGELVLVVDDEDGVRDIARRTLERYGYRVVVPANGAEAVAVYARQQADVAVVLTDMAMPIMDGPALIVALRAINAAVKIIGSSGLASNRGIARALGAGVSQFVPKPYTARALLTTLRKAIDNEPAS